MKTNDKKFMALFEAAQKSKGKYNSDGVLIELSEEQKALIEPWAEYAIEYGTSLEDGTLNDTKQVTEDVGAMYKAGGLKAPEYVIVVDSHYAMSFLAPLLEKSTPEENQTLFNGGWNTKEIVALAEKYNITPNFSGVCSGQHDSNWINFYQFLRKACNIETEVDLDPLHKFSSYSGWFIPFEGACLISRRPTTLCLEKTPRRPGEPKRLHNMDGPAVTYQDGTSYYFIAGVKVPEVICNTASEDLDPLLFFKEENAEIRNAIGAKIGMERLIDKMNAKSLDVSTLRNEAGFVASFEVRDTELPAWAADSNGQINLDAVAYELLEVNLPGDITAKYLKMGNPSENKIHVEGVSPECKTVLDAKKFRWPTENYQQPDVLA